ncbi:hypothetical protein BH23THE1_BH23THE1_17380 [soil metagenome]
MNIRNDTSSRHTITISNPILIRLKKYGLFGESYSLLINRLLDSYEKTTGMDKNDKYSSN